MENEHKDHLEEQREAAAKAFYESLEKLQDSLNDPPPVIPSPRKIHPKLPKSSPRPTPSESTGFSVADLEDAIADIEHFLAEVEHDEPSPES